MTPKMVAGFRRSLSFPNHSSSSSKPPKTTLHVRSTSLPCTSHPLISQLKDSINDLISTWSNFRPENHLTSSSQLCDGLSRLNIVHGSLDDLLQLPQTRDSLRGNVHWVEKVLEDFLTFVDVYGIFQSLILALKQEHLAAQLAIRRRDDSKAGVHMKGLKKTAKDMGKLVSTVRTIGSYPVPDAELCEVIRDVSEMTVLVSAALFNGISSAFVPRKSSWMGLKYSRKVRGEERIEEFRGGLIRGWRREKNEEAKMVMMKKMEEMEECMGGIECRSEKVFRSLINTRVSLLNVLTQ